MFKRAMVLAMMSAGALAGAATDTKGAARKSEARASTKAGTETADNQERSLLTQAILILHGGKNAQGLQSKASDSNPQCSRCHG